MDVEDKNLTPKEVFPEFKLFDPLSRLRALGRALLGCEETPNTGATVILDEEIDLREVVPEETQLWLDFATNEEMERE